MFLDATRATTLAARRAEFRSAATLRTDVPRHHRALPSRASGRPAATKIMCTASTDSKYFMLTYDYVPEILEKRGPYREGHLAMAKEQIAAGNMLMGGPQNPPDGAFFLWKCTDSAIVEEFVQNDPYVKAGLVPGYSIKEWTVLLQAD